ncbi:MAG: anti-sigma factor [Xanthobacteraceae bacterium]|nr:anti-sigma factor [Xanthobacteraceae bacterium]
MFDEDQDTLAAEYVLGTLSAEEREHAEALRSFDPGFEAAVRQWERRLGELNVMVEAVEPPPQVWEKITAEVTTPAAAGETASPRDLDEPSSATALASDFVIIESTAAPIPQAETAAETPAVAAALSPSPTPEARTIERSADVIYLADRVKRWRTMTVAFGALAALLALYVALWQAAPDLIPAQLRPAGSTMMARSEGPARMQQDQLVAVLQQGPTAPAFLLTLDTQRRTLFVRRVSATPEAGKSYELWLIASGLGAPRSLGIIGSDEFTQRALPANYDVNTLRGATYAVSLEPAGGSNSGAPTGPVLFTGKAVETLPTTPPKPATPKT